MSSPKAVATAAAAIAAAANKSTRATIVNKAGKIFNKLPPTPAHKKMEAIDKFINPKPDETMIFSQQYKNSKVFIF